MADIIAGLLDGFTNHNNKEYIESCYQTDFMLDAMLDEAVKDFSSGNIDNYIKGGKAIFTQAETILRVIDYCPDYQNEMQTFTRWIQEIAAKRVKGATEFAIENFAHNRFELLADAESIS